MNHSYLFPIYIKYSFKYPGPGFIQQIPDRDTWKGPDSYTKIEYLSRSYKFKGDEVCQLTVETQHGFWWLQRW
jgi:hypothetical protein